tara:strand:+ start:345 stop:623 length:279 start_codon:yes stop_codon:yes gene_type:complete
VVSESKDFSKFAVIRQIPFIKDEIFSANNLRNNSSDFVGIIMDVEGTGPDAIEISIGPIFKEFSKIEIIIPFSKFSMLTLKVRFSYVIVFEL